MQTSLNGDKYFQILGYLYANGLGQKTDIFFLFDGIHFSVDALDNRIEKLYPFLDQMVNNRHIVYDKPLIDVDINDLTDGKYDPMTTYPLMALITHEGLLFHYQKVQIDNLEETRKWNKRNIIATLMVAGLSLIVSVLTAVKSYFDNDNKQKTQIRYIDNHRHKN